MDKNIGVAVLGQIRGSSTEYLVFNSGQKQMPAGK